MGWRSWSPIATLLLGKAGHADGRRNGVDNRKAYGDVSKTEPLQGCAGGDEGVGGARELRAGERAGPFADRSGQDTRLADQWLRLLHPYAYERGARSRRDRGAALSARRMARIAALQRARARRPCMDRGSNVGVRDPYSRRRLRPSAPALL